MSNAEPSSPALLTAEAFQRRHGSDDFAELVEGRVVRMPPPGGPHGRVDSRLSALLGAHIRRHRLGEHYLNTGFILRRDPDVVRLPDEAFISAQRLLATPEPREGYWETVPDLVVEIVSPDDKAADLAEKLRDYLVSGVRLAWFIYPMNERVYVHRPDGAMSILEGDSLLDGGDVVPGFSVALSELWATPT